MGENIKRLIRADNVSSRLFNRHGMNAQIETVRESTKLWDKISIAKTSGPEEQRIFAGWVIAKYDEFFVLQGERYREAYMWIDLIHYKRKEVANG